MCKTFRLQHTHYFVVHRGNEPVSARGTAQRIQSALVHNEVEAFVPKGQLRGVHDQPLHL